MILALRHRGGLPGWCGLLGIAGVLILWLLWACGSGGGGGAATSSAGSGDTDSGTGQEACPNFAQSEGTPSATASISTSSPNHTKTLSANQSWAATLAVTDGTKVAWAVFNPTAPVGGTVSPATGFSTTYTAPITFPPAITTGTGSVEVRATLTSTAGAVCRTSRVSLNNEI